MALSMEHLKRNPSERKIAGAQQNYATAVTQFNRADRLLQEVLCDLVNGLTKNDIILKFAEKMYENQRKKIGEKQAKEYIKLAYLIMAEDRVQEQDKLRDQFYEQYMNLYNEALTNGNQQLAKQILDSMTKTFLPDEKNIRLDANSDGDIIIDFSFGE